LTPLTLAVKEAKVTVPMRLMTAGEGYKHLLKSVAAGDGDRPSSHG
jgi:hypothetical protein